MASFLNRSTKTICIASLGFLLRILVTSGFKDTLRQRVEVTTPTSDWKRAHEAIYLWNSGLDPYAGNIFHEYPVSLQLYKFISTYISIDYAFAIAEVLTALLLQQSTIQQQLLNGHTKDAAHSTSFLVLTIYSLSPVNIIACAGQTTTIFTNFLIAIILFILPLKPFRLLTCVLCGFLAANNMHFGTLIIPIFACIEFCSNKRHAEVEFPYYKSANFFQSLVTSFGICVASFLTLLGASYFLMGNSWTFLKSTYLFSIYIQDLTPNIGMFWYFLTEMFDHFLDFFTFIIQINAFIHVIPLTVCLRDKPFFALFMTLLTSSFFQPYPNLANIGLITSLLPQYSSLFTHFRHGLKVVCATVTCACLWPLFWHLWIVMGTANSNFYFGATLAFVASLVLLMVDLLNSHNHLKAKRKYDEHLKETEPRQA